MNTNKFTIIMEKLWLAIAIATAIYALYKFFTGAQIQTLEYLMPLLAFVLYLTRRALRKKLEAAAEDRDRNSIDQ